VSRASHQAVTVELRKTAGMRAEARAPKRRVAVMAGPGMEASGAALWPPVHGG
jgi:hypothetical protein